MIWSASRIVETRWATTTTVESPVVSSGALRSRASVATSRAENESSKTKIFGSRQRPGDAEPLPLSAGEVRAALGDTRLKLIGLVGHEVVGLGRGQCLPQFRIIGEPVLNRRLEAIVPENRYGFCGTRPTSCASW